VLVLDASASLHAAEAARGFEAFRDPDLVAPLLMWSEARSVLHERWWRGELDRVFAETMRVRIEKAPVHARRHPRLGDEAWRIADQLGWAKTYDAEYVALASLLSCRLVTVDTRLRRGAERLGFVIGPDEL
jgi:predicted nucleic acid-binding protein